MTTHLRRFLKNADSLKADHNITVEGIRLEIAGCPRPEWTSKTREKQDRLFQNRYRHNYKE